MKVSIALALSGLLVFSHAANGEGLIGETLTFARAYPTTTTPYWNPSSTTTTVTAGTDDVITWKWLPGASGTTSINPEATNITWSGTTSQYIGNQTTFDGFIVSGFNSDIASVSVLNSGGFTIDIAPTLRSFSVNLSGTGSSFVLDVQLAPVPEPSAVALVVTGFIALFLTNKRPRAKSSALIALGA